MRQPLRRRDAVSGQITTPRAVATQYHNPLHNTSNTKGWLLLGMLLTACLLVTTMIFVLTTTAFAQSTPSDATSDVTMTSESGVVTIESNQDVEATAISLTTALADAGLTVFGVVDHAANAAEAGLELPPTFLIVVGNAELGTPLMQANRAIALDLPQKFVVWEKDGQTYISYNDPVYIAERHGITGEEEVIDQITNALSRFANMATGSATSDASGTDMSGSELSMSETMTDTAAMTETADMTSSVDITDTDNAGTSGSNNHDAADNDVDEITGGEAVTDTATVTDTETVTDEETMSGTTGMTNTGDMTAAMSSAVLIQFGENRISAAEFDRSFVQAMRNFANQQGIPLNESTVFFFADLRDRYLEQFATEEVLLAEAADRGIEISDDEATDLIQPLKTNFIDDAAYQTALEAAGFADESELIDAVKDDATINALIETLQADITVSDEEVRTFYEENTNLFRVDAGVLLPLEQVEGRINELLIQEQLQERIAEIRTEQGVEIFTGNLTPFDELLMSELGISSGMTDTQTMTDTATMTGTTTVTNTDTVTATDIIAPDEIPPIPITETATITHVQPMTATSDVTATDHVSASFVSPIPDADPDADIMTDTATMTATTAVPETVTDSMTETTTTELAEEAAALSLIAQDQQLTGASVWVDVVVSDGPGWVVVHTDDNGQPGAVIGYQLVDPGLSADVVVPIDLDAITDNVHVMLHEDTGSIGVYEYPDGDAPATVDGEVIVESIMLIN